MQIPNPWPHHARSRCTCKTPKGDVVVMVATRGPIEVADDCEEVVIEPVRMTGRGGKHEVIGPARIWSKNWGLLDIEDHLKKTNLANEEAEMKARKAKEKAEAKARKAKAKVEAKVYKEKPAKAMPEKAKPSEVKLDAASKLNMSDGMDSDGMYNKE